MTTGFPVSPLTPATFLLVGLAEVDLADHQRRTIPYAFAITLVMTLVALATGAIGRTGQGSSSRGEPTATRAARSLESV